jgi:type III restriction enzyme
MSNSNPFFDQPILSSPYAALTRHWELDEQGQPTQKTVENRRRAEFITPIPNATMIDGQLKARG